MFVRNLAILFIDDEITFTQAVAEYLRQRYGHESRLLPSVEEAYKELPKSNYDLIFLDYKFPGATGLEFLRWAAEKKIETPVIMLTGKGAEEIAADAMKLGAYDYISKTNLALDYLPVAINNTYERFVLRKAKEQSEAERIARERNELAIKTFQTTVKSFAHHINNALANILLRAQSYRRKLTKQQQSPQRTEIESTLLDLEESAKIIEAVVAALVSLNGLVTKKFDIEKGAVDIQAELEKTIQELGKKKQKTAVGSKEKH